jgi:putative FmdB family regulatory protein
VPPRLAIIREALSDSTPKRFTVPTYEYRCHECGHQFERAQRMSDAPLTDCEVCGGQVQRVLFAPAIHFKGTGFYNTDYGSKRRAKEGDDGGSTSTNGDAASGDSAGGGDAKPKVKEATPADKLKRAGLTKPTKAAASS